MVAILPPLSTAEGIEPDPTHPTDLVEETESRLAQIDVAVTGPPDVIADLGPADFKLKVNLRWLEEFALDSYCEPAPDARGETTRPAARPAVRYLFYFDQPHLTLPGRARAIDVARDLVTRLVNEHDQAMIVSNASRLAVIEEFTGDRPVLLEALARLENDRTQWDFYATEEASRVARVVEVLNEDDSIQRAVGIARSYQREEHARTDRNLRRLRITLSRLSEIDLPKVVIYFADYLRQNPGEHFLSFFGTRVQRSTAALGPMTAAAFSGRLAFDEMINQASAQGIRLYPVSGEGLVTPFDRDRVNAATLTRAGAVPASSRVRLRDAQETLASMASETGGHVFVHGESPARIAHHLLEDLACVYTLSFDPTGFPEDQPLAVTVRPLRPEVRTESRGRMVIQSTSSRLASRLLSAFAVGVTSDTDFGLRANLVATGYDRGFYSALLQIGVPGTRLPTARWELGATLIRREKVVEEISGTLAVARPGVPVVLEREITLRAGTHEIVAVAHESQTGVILSEHLQVAWPDPDHEPVSSGPLTLLQPEAGAFVRSGDARSAGSLARSATESVRAELPTALLGLVCRNRRDQGLLRVERTLIGETAIEFPLIQFEFAGDRCAQVRDLIPAGSLRAGPYRYVMRVMQADSLLHEVSRDFVAISPGS